LRLALLTSTNWIVFSAQMDLRPQSEIQLHLPEDYKLP
jgi:hypothetical protein